MTHGLPDAPAEALVRERIARGAPLTFRDFMSLALYAPGVGYYSRPDATTGKAGDFSTSPDVSPEFGRCLARQAIDVHDALGGGAWSFVELGPGRGLLARDLLGALREEAPGSWDALRQVVLVERSESLRGRLEESVGPAAPPGRLRVLSELPAEPVGDGFLVGNELLDALPVHLVERGPDGLSELYVTVDGSGRLALEAGPVSDPRMLDRARRDGLCPEEGWRAEICLDLESLVEAVAHTITRGAALFVDYGHDAAALSDPRHADGTLVGYRGHVVTTDPLDSPGLVDLTAHVNWTHLDDVARAAGLVPAGRVTQERMLLALGILGAFEIDAVDGDSREGAARRLAAKRLILPGAGGGTRFEGALYVRGIPADRRMLRAPARPRD